MFIIIFFLNLNTDYKLTLTKSKISITVMIQMEMNNKKNYRALFKEVFQARLIKIEQILLIKIELF